MAGRYALVSALYAPHRGGVETFTENLAHELACEGDEVVVVTSQLSQDAPPFEQQEDGVAVWRLPCLPLMNGRLPLPRKGRAFGKLVERIASQSYDGMLINTRFYGMSLEGARLACKIGAPAIVLDHGADWLTMGNPVIDAAIRGYERLMTARVKRYHPTFAGISRKSTEWLRTFGIDTDLVISNAIDAAAFRASSSGRDYRHELGISDSQKLVAFVGRLEPEKGPDALARALAVLGPEYVGVFAGEGSLRGEIEALGLDNLHLVGNVSHQDVSALFAQADVFCLPTKSEGFCLGILEAAAWGVPVAIPDVGVASEVLGETYARLEPPFDDVAAKIVEATSLDTTEVRRHVEEDFTWKTTAREVKEAFEAIVQSAR